MEETKTKKGSGWSSDKTFTVVGMGLLTAIIVVLQWLAVSIKFGPFSITLVLAPIIVGAALYGWKAGAWLGFVFSVVVLLTGDAAAFLAVNIPGTIVTVILKGTVAGIAAGLVYRAISRKNQLLAVIASGVTAPVVNTGIFILGCLVFFLPTIEQWGVDAGFQNAFAYIFIGMVGLNFLVELAINMVLSSMIVAVINLVKKKIAA